MERFMKSCKQIKISANKKKIPETFKRIYNGDQIIKQSFIICRLDTDEYKILTAKAVSSIYKKIPDKINDKLNSEGKRIMEKKTALNRMFNNGKNHFFIILKDHKPHLVNKSRTRLLNLTKNELGRITKVLLKKINLNLQNPTKVNQWKNTSDIISCHQKHHN